MSVHDDCRRLYEERVRRPIGRSRRPMRLVLFSMSFKPDATSWFRLGRRGPGLAWKPADAPRSFCQRMGITKTWVVGGWRFHYLKRRRADA